jgi:hypothetical protein
MNIHHKFDIISLKANGICTPFRYEHGAERIIQAKSNSLEVISKLIKDAASGIHF